MQHHMAQIAFSPKVLVETFIAKTLRQNNMIALNEYFNIHLFIILIFHSPTQEG